MSQIFRTFCFLLFVFQGVEGDDGGMVIEDNDSATITCSVDNPGTVFWFRLNENGQGFEHIAMYSRSKNSGKEADPKKFKVNEKSLELKQFEQQKDSGTYSRVFINNNELKFTCTTKLRGVTVTTTMKPKVHTTPMKTEAIMTPPAVTCIQKTKEKASGNIAVLLDCEQRILIPLAVGCGFLFLLLLITCFYCNRIRTRRCPHHYKRQPRSRPAGHKTLPNPPDY